MDQTQTRTQTQTQLHPSGTHTELSDDDVDDAADHDQSVKRVPGVHEVMLEETKTPELMSSPRSDIITFIITVIITAS